MSSFEPLFGEQPARTTFTPRSAGSGVVADAWIPIQVNATSRRGLSVFDVQIDHSSEADHAAAHAILEQTRQAELDEAYLRGMHEGREQGEQGERARLRGAMMAAESALDDVRAGETRWLANIEENIAAIAIAVAQQIVGREVATSSDMVLTIVTRAVQEFGLDQALSIRLNPGDLESLQSVERSASEDPTSTVTTGREVRWLSDARIEPGGCVVEGRERIVDGRVDTGLERLYRRLTYTNA